MNNIKAVCIQTIHSMLLYIPLVQKLHQAVCNMERTTSAECGALEQDLQDQAHDAQISGKGFRPSCWQDSLGTST